MTNIARRTFLQAAAATTGGVLVGGSLQTLLAGAAGAKPPSRDLVEIPDLRDGKVRLHLPEGFEYRSFHDTDVLPGSEVTLDDGTLLPGRHDGMAAFDAPGGNVWLVRNHEVNGPVGAFGPGAPYDTAAGGGTTTSLVTPTGEVLESFTSLNGTQMNCAGGAMPWGSWLTCEETVNGPEVGDDFTGQDNSLLTQPHGYVFEVLARGPSNRQPIRSAGRFAHEAAAYSPSDKAVYLTEDNFGFPSGFYRYLPPSNPMAAGRLEDGGVLQMLKVAETDNAHLEARQSIGASYAIEWVTIADPDPDMTGLTNNEAITMVGSQGRAQGAAGFSRLEGAVFTKGEVWFTSTQGGGDPDGESDTTNGYGNGTGQVWSYDPRRQRLTCRYQAPDDDVLDMPDNITARSSRGTIVICEDGPTENYIRGLTRRGQLFDIALNRLTRNFSDATRYGEEFAGATFARGTLFVNIQASQGITFAIWGPWGRLGV